MRGLREAYVAGPGNIINELSRLGFCDTKQVINRPSIADVFHERDRCGIYILHFADGAYYVGQAVDIPRRYIQHKKNHQDITYISFKNVKKCELNESEAEAIGSLEMVCDLRNISLTSAPISDSDLDDILSLEEQSGWLCANESVVNYKTRLVDATMRSKYARSFLKLKNNAFFMDSILPVMKKYVRRCIPEPCLTELSFWCCTCLPSGHANANVFEVYSRFNIHWQEVFTVGKHLDTKEPHFSWHLKRSDLWPVILNYKQYSTSCWSEHYYRSGGRDQFKFQIFNTDEALAILDDCMFVQAIKEFNIRNMRKGTNNWAINHCMDLADFLLPI